MKTLKFLRVTALAVGTLTVSLLTGSSTMAQWVRVTNGQIPNNAVIGGFEEAGRLYIARVNHEGGVHIGKAKQGEPTAFIPYGGREISLPNYEVYLGDGSMGRYGRWQPVKPGQPIPANAIQGGNEADGTPLYVARANVENSLHPGKAKGNAAFIPYGGQERIVNQFDVLVGEPGAPTSPAGSQSFGHQANQISHKLTAGAQEQPAPTPVSPVTTEPATPDGFVCTTQQIKFSEGNFEKIVVGGVDAKIYPGAFVLANDVLDGSFRPYLAPRAPYSIGLVGLTGPNSGRLQATVSRTESQSDVEEVIAPLLNANRNVQNSASIAFYSKQVFSENQLQVLAGGSFSGWGLDVRASFGFNERSASNYYLMKITQKYFTVKVNANDPRTLFSNSAFRPANDALYVSEVSYGRIGYLSIKTNRSEQEIRAAIQATYTGTASGSASLDVNTRKVMEDCEINGFAFGGPPVTITSVETFQEFVGAGQNWEPARGIKAISYKLRFLSNNAEAFTSMTTDYAERRCVKIEKLKIAFEGIFADGCEGYCYGRDPLWGYVTLKFYDRLSQKEILPEDHPDGRIWSRPDNDPAILTRAYGNWVRTKLPEQRAETPPRQTFYYLVDPKALARNEITAEIRGVVGLKHADRTDIMGVKKDGSWDYHGTKGEQLFWRGRLNELLDVKQDGSFSPFVTPAIAGDRDRYHEFRILLQPGRE